METRTALLIGILSCSTLCACSEYNPPTESRVLQVDTVAASSVENLALLSSVSSNKDAAGMAAMLADGRAVRIPAQTKVTSSALDSAREISIVFIDSGPLVGRTLYVATSQLSATAPPATH